jgi:hypothetical protein
MDFRTQPAQSHKLAHLAAIADPYSRCYRCGFPALKHTEDNHRDHKEMVLVCPGPKIDDASQTEKSYKELSRRRQAQKEIDVQENK